MYRSSSILLRSVDVRKVLNVSPRLFAHSAQPTRMSPNEFGNMSKSDVLVDHIQRPTRKFEHTSDSHHVKKLKSISVPVGLSVNQLERLRLRQEAENLPSNGRLLIECSKKEFNQCTDYSLPHGVRIPLCSEFWEKNKYKDHWFTIKRANIKTHSNESMHSTWESFVPDKLDPLVLEALKRLALLRPVGVQAQCLMSFFSRNHLFYASETGSGKTVAFAAPLLTSLLQDKRKGVNSKAIVITATGALKHQIHDIVSQLALGSGLSVKCSDKEETNKVGDWDILIGTPGLVELELRTMEDTNSIKQVVLDEADMLLDESFTGVLTEIFSLVKVAHSETNLGDRQTGARLIFCSASCPEELELLAEAVVDREFLSYVRSHHLHSLLHNIEMKFMRVREMDKMARLSRLLDDDYRKGDKNQTLVFCKDRKTAQFLHSALTTAGRDTMLWSSESTTSTAEQCRVMIATDLAARGIDLPRLSHVINYDMARHAVDYLHRCGRVGRLSSMFPARVTSFVRTASEIRLTNAIELASRLGKPLSNVEADVSGYLKSKTEKA